MGELGLMEVDLPEAFGGLEAPGVTMGIIAEELAYGDFNASAVPVGVSLLGAIIMSSATPRLAEYWIPRMIRGETLMGVCVTEPSCGSDAGAMKLRCGRDGDTYVLDIFQALAAPAEPKRKKKGGRKEVADSDACIFAR